jgi:quinol monooxygenase YgiN
MFGLIGRIKAHPGKRGELARVLVQEDGSMPGCLSYVVAEDANDMDALWVTEVWTDQEAWRASLQLPAVQAAIARGRPLIAGFDSRVETKVLGGIGLGGTP